MLSVAILCTDLPEWQWVASRRGMGWEYLGTKGDRKVTVYPVAIIVGHNGDDFETQWRVEESGKATTYAGFWLREASEQGKGKQ